MGKMMGEQTFESLSPSPRNVVGEQIVSENWEAEFEKWKVVPLSFGQGSY